jgi:hypothetical protein
MQAQDIINVALKHIGVLASGMTAAPEEYTDALEQLNSLITKWDTERLNIFAIQVNTYTLTGGTQAYTMGTGGTLTGAARAVSIRQANIVSLTGGFHFELKPMTAEEFASIPERGVSAHIPRSYYYDNNYPLATIYLYPVPSDASTLELFTWEQLTGFALLTTTFDMPPAYQLAIGLNLAILLAPMFGRQLDPNLATRAEEALNAVKALNLPPTPGAGGEGDADAKAAQIESGARQ